MQEVSRLAEEPIELPGAKSSPYQQLTRGCEKLGTTYLSSSRVKERAGVSWQSQLAVSLGPPAPTSEFLCCGTALVRLR